MKLTMVEALNLALKQEMSKDKRVIILGEDVGVDGGVFRITDDLIKEFGEERVIDTPLAESGIIGTSIGLAANDMKPVAEIQFAGFLYSGFDQLISHASRIRNRSRGRFTAPIVVRTPYGGGVKALEHHSESMEAIYIHTPGLKVVMPSRPYNAKGLLISAIRDPDPVIFFEPTKIYRSVKEEVPEEEYTIPLGKAEVVKQGKDVTVICYGAMVKMVLETVLTLNIDVEVIDLQTLSPMDTETIINSVKKTGRAVVIHEAPRTCGLGAEITARINEQAFKSLKAPVARVTGYDIIPPLPKLEDYYMPNPKKLVNAIKKVMEG